MALLGASQLLLLEAFRNVVRQLEDVQLPEDISRHEMALLLTLSRIDQVYGQRTPPDIRFDRPVTGEQLQSSDDKPQPIPVDNITLSLLYLVEAIGQAKDAPPIAGPQAAASIRSKREDAQRLLGSRLDFDL